MDIGLYTLKYPFRKLIAFLLPFFKKSNPNNISWFLILVGILMAVVFWSAISWSQPWLFIVGVILGFVRMIVATLDGLVAIEYHKSSVLGDVINRVTPEICDLMLYPVLVAASLHFDLLGIGVLAMSWAISYAGLLGAASGCPVQSVGPCGQTDRLATLMLFSFLQAFSLWLNWEIHFIDLFFYWVLLGGAVTLGLRLRRTFKAAQERDVSNAISNR